MRILDDLVNAVGAANVLTGDAVKEDYSHDEALTVEAVRPLAVVLPGSTADVVEVLRSANASATPVTARGGGTGLSGACVPVEGGIVVSFERMQRVLEIDEDNHTVEVEAGVQLDQLDAALAPRGLFYPVHPGELSGTLGGNVNTNAGGMRAVKYGVTRHQVLGLEVVLPTGEVLTTGGKFVKGSSGYDLTALIIGSEGTLALVTRAHLRVYPRRPFGATILAPFSSLDAVAAAVPKVVSSGVEPVLLEYIDMVTMAAMTSQTGLELGVPDEIRSTALAYLVVGLEGRARDRLDEDTAEVAELLGHLGAMDVYVLPEPAARALIEAREKAFWLAKASGADDILDVVVPRGAIPAFMDEVAAIASDSGTWISGCGHAGDGNVHLAVFQKDPSTRLDVERRVFEAGLRLGGAMSGEHGIGRAKRELFGDLEDPAKLALMRRIKEAFDPNGILNPGVAAL